MLQRRELRQRCGGRPVEDDDSGPVLFRSRGILEEESCDDVLHLHVDDGKICFVLEINPTESDDQDLVEGVDALAGASSEGNERMMSPVAGCFLARA